MVYNPKSGPILRPPAAIVAPRVAHFRVVCKIVKHLEIKNIDVLIRSASICRTPDYTRSSHTTCGAASY